MARRWRRAKILVTEGSLGQGLVMAPLWAGGSIQTSQTEVTSWQPGKDRRTLGKTSHDGTW